MAWPPPVLPINRTNALSQQDTHAADHNAANLAINDIVPQLQSVLTKLASTAVGGLSNVGKIVNGAAPGGSVPAAGEIEVASMVLPAGLWVVNYNVLVSSPTVFVATFKMIGGIVTPRVHSLPAPQIQGTGASTTYSVTSLARAGRVSFNIGAPYAANPLTVYADPTNHQLFAVGAVDY